MKRLAALLSLLALAISSHLMAYENQPSTDQTIPRDTQSETTIHPDTTTPSETSNPSDTTTGSILWYTKYSEALDIAKKQNKPLLLFFTGSDWCGWCKKIDSEVFKDPEFKNLVGNRFVFVLLDFPMNKMLPLDISEQNAQFKHKFGITGYPTVVILSPNESFIAETGYRPGGGKAYADYLNSLIQK